MEELLARYFSGEASEEEAARVLEWRSTSEENARIYFEARRVWIASGPVASPDHALLHSILEESEAQEVKVIPLWNQRLFKLAVALLVVIGAIFAVIQVSDNQPYGEVMTEVTPFNLPDGSHATLQRGASIIIEDFEDTRVVHLSGKAFFEVVPDESRPFMVRTEGASVTVLGTSFLVNTTEAAGSTEVLVASGVVSLSETTKALSGEASKVQLRKGEMGKLVVGKGIQKEKISDDNYLSWKTKILTFRKTSLGQVSDKFRDVYGVGLVFENQSLAQCNLTAKFHQKSPDEVVDIIARTFGLTYQRSGENYILFGEGCK